jgi:cbb3-type cytochrome oxidase subunit 3
MKLSDIMGHMGLAGYAEVALAIFLVVFIAATIWAYLPSNRHRFSVAMNLPLEDGAPAVSRHAFDVRPFDADTLAMAGSTNDEVMR